jgi:hypothetical protein
MPSSQRHPALLSHARKERWLQQTRKPWPPDQHQAGMLRVVRPPTRRNENTACTAPSRNALGARQRARGASHHGL